MRWSQVLRRSSPRKSSKRFRAVAKASWTASEARSGSRGIRRASVYSRSPCSTSALASASRRECPGVELGMDVLEHLIRLVAGAGLEDGGDRALPDEGVDLGGRDEVVNAVLEGQGIPPFTPL